jgi:hypothetical protein
MTASPPVDEQHLSGSSPILDLNDTAALDQSRVGAKAASLAAGQRLGLPVLPGFVVQASASMGHLAAGAEALAIRGSGGARLSISALPPPGPDQLVSRGAELSSSLVARSSSPLEGSAEWAGAFASYVGLAPEELPRAVVGCWASVFTVDALARHEATGHQPGATGMAVLVQPMIEPYVSGTAEFGNDDSVVVHVTEGSPAPLLQGWVRGDTARFVPDRGWDGAAAIALVGEATLEEIRSLLQTAEESFGRCRLEWGLSEELWVLQLSATPSPHPMPRRRRFLTTKDLLPTVRALMTAPGRLGRELVLPWAVAGLPGSFRPSAGLPGSFRPSAVPDGDLLDQAVTLSRELTEQVWALPSEDALTAAASVLGLLRGFDPSDALGTIETLQTPDPERAGELMGIISELGARLASAGVLRDAALVWHFTVAELGTALERHRRLSPGRIGAQPWEPVVAAVVLDHGNVVQGTAAAVGLGAGVRHRVATSGDGPPPRSVITATGAFPSLSQLLWDAAALVTDAGSPAAHVFEAARSLGVPAVCGVGPGADEDVIVAVDGYTGLVGTLPLSSRI